MTPNDAEDDRKPQAPPGELRREERVEDPARRFAIHSAPVVGDIEMHVGSFRQALVEVHPGEEGAIADPKARREDDLALAIADRLNGIDDEIMMTWWICPASASTAGRPGVNRYLIAVRLGIRTSSMRTMCATTSLRSNASMANRPFPE